MAVIGGFRSDLSITCKPDGNFGNVSAGVLFSKVAYQRKRVVTRCEVLKPHLEGVTVSYSLLDWTPELSDLDLSPVQGLCVLWQATRSISTSFG